MTPDCVVRLTAMLLISFSAQAFACGQVGPCEPTEPGGQTTIRGYGYGYEGGDRPVTLVWVADGTTAAHGQIDANGEFELRVTGPMKPGSHKLMVRQGNADPVPVEVVLPVVLPASALRLPRWVRAAAADHALPWVLGGAGLALVFGLTVLAGRGRRRPVFAG